jgi:hypothetical protein
MVPDRVRAGKPHVKKYLNVRTSQTAMRNVPLFEQY